MNVRSLTWSIMLALCTYVAGCAGPAGSSCSVEENADGTATIACGDGTTAIVRNGDDGVDGMDGMDGTSCTVDTGAANEAILTCEDGTTATITNGVDGMDGMDGTSCSVAEAAGVATITCEDGTTASVSDGAGCTVVDNGDGTSTVGCDDGTTTTLHDGAQLETETLPFPGTGDVRMTASGPNFWNVNDYVEGTRTTTLVPLRGLLTLQVTANGLSGDTQDVEILINGRNAANFSIPGGTGAVTVPFSTAAIVGPTFTIRLRTTRTVSPGAGSAGYGLDSSTITLTGISES